MNTRKALLGLVSVAMWTTLGPALAVLSVNQGLEYCSQWDFRLHCVFRNTSEDVEVVSVAPGVREVTVEAAATLHGSPPCGTNLHVWSSTNVTLQGAALPHTIDINSQPRQKRNLGLHVVENRASHSRGGSSRGATSAFSTAKSVSSSFSEESVSYSVSVEERGASCARNVSVVQSKLCSLRGKFDLTRLRLSQVGELDGEFDQLDVRRSEVSNFSASGRSVVVEETKIQLLSRLEGEAQLQLRHVHIDRLVAPGLSQEATHGKQRIYFNNEATHTLSDLDVGVMETEAMVVRGRVSVTSMTVGEVDPAAITVAAGGVLTLTNIHISQGPQTCLVLLGASKVVLNNFTLINETITHLELSSKSSQKIAYPLLTVWPGEVVVSPGVEGTLTAPAGNEDTFEKDLPGFSWYWVVIMTVVGIFAGIVIGTAFVWRKSSLKKGQPSVLTLSDLIARDRLQEDSEEHIYDSPNHLELTRRDSGLTSSSFASFTPCHERPRLSVSSLKHQPEPDVCQPHPTEPNVYVHVPPLAYTREDVIFEEVEALGGQKVDNHYLPMK